MDNQKLKIEPGCISCGSCQFIAPEIFELDIKSKIKDNANIKDNIELIKIAISKCPVNVIKLINKDE